MDSITITLYDFVQEEYLIKNLYNLKNNIKYSLFKNKKFWKLHSTTILNDRQQKIINRLLDGFDGKLTTSKWGKINKCSQDTALRDIQDLIKKNILQKEASGGRSTNYELKTY